jgi:ribosomal protein S18 acetylase RimI-like enzyme
LRTSVFWALKDTAVRGLWVIYLAKLTPVSQRFELMLLVRETNTEVVGFYKHLGFETVPRVTMQKWLEKGHD